MKKIALKKRDIVFYLLWGMVKGVFHLVTFIPAVAVAATADIGSREKFCFLERYFDWVFRSDEPINNED